MDGTQHHGLDSEPRSKPQHDAPLAVDITTTLPATPQLVDNKDDRRPKHVAVLAEHMPADRQLLGLQTESGVVAIQDSTAPGVDCPEQAVPGAGTASLEAQRCQRIHQATLDVAAHQRRQLGGHAVVEPVLAEPEPDGALRPRQRRLRRGRHEKDGALRVRGGRRVGTDDHGAGAIAEKGVGNELVELSLVGGAE